MQITILGKSPAWTDAGGACSSYLVQHGDAAVLIDCGNGAFGKLRDRIDYLAVDAVVISHLHADHYFDLVPYSFALTHSPRQQAEPLPPWPGTGEPARPRLYGPPGAAEVFGRLGGLVGFEDLVPSAFEVAEFDPAVGLQVGELTLSFAAVPHFIDAFAIEARAPGSGRFTYGSDCRPAEELVEFARDTDLLLVESTVPRPESGEVRGHMTPAEAARHGCRAGAGRVILTHISDEFDPDLVLAEAAAEYPGSISIAREGDVYEL